MLTTNKINRKTEVLKMIKLMKFKNGKWQIVDYGVESMMHLYLKQGYVVVAKNWR
jgi:hypothetical protein